MMGNLVYIIGYINKNVNGNYVLCDIYDDPSKWNDSQRQCLNDYLTYIVNSESKSGALRNRFTQPIYNDNVTSFIDKCEYIRLHYRNEAAHTHNINYETAERCHCDILEAINSVIIKLFEIVDINKIIFQVNNFFGQNKRLFMQCVLTDIFLLRWLNFDVFFYNI